MKKTFQFSMRRLFAAVALFCVAAALLAAMPHSKGSMIGLAEFLTKVRKS